MYHELTTRYNVFFNAQESYNQILKSSFENHKENWHNLLPMYPNNFSADDIDNKSLGGPYDRVIQKTTKAIQEHSISTKPKRDRSRINSQSYRDWLRQNEFNPFIDQAWLLMGKAHLQNGDYIESISVLSNTIRLFSYDLDVVSEAQIHMIRAYAQLGWYSDAEVLVDGLLARSLSGTLKKEFIEVHTFLLLQQEKYEEAIPYLRETVLREKNNVKKRRLWFLLGQLYTKVGKGDDAYQAFEKVKRLTTPNEFALNALLAQAVVSGYNDKVLDGLKRQAKKAKNEEFLCQIYSAIGYYFIIKNDTVNALENYLIAESVDDADALDKALVQEKIGSIYYDQKAYVASANRYKEMIDNLPKEYPNYKEIAYRTSLLNELAPYIIAVETQDSLQHLAKLPKDEQLEIINKHIIKLKKQARDVGLETFEMDYHIGQSNQFSGEGGNIGLQSNINTTDGFYFYNHQQVALGINEFKRIWGNRKLEDNWRLINKSSIRGSELESTDISVLDDNLNIDEIESLGREDIDLYSTEYYLSQLPLNPEDIVESNKIIESSLFEVAKIAKDKLHDFDLAKDSYNRILNDFSTSPHIAEVMYDLYLIYRQMGDEHMSSHYRNKIISEYPSHKYAVMMKDPEYELVMSNFAQMEGELYNTAYKAYQLGDVPIVQQSYTKAKRLFINSSLMPKFQLLNALSYALIQDAESLKSELEDLVKSYPETLETDFAQNILDGLREGRELVANTSAIFSTEWMSKHEEEITEERETEAEYESEIDRDQPHNYLVIFDSDVQKKNELLFAISEHNFTNYQLLSFTTSFIKIGELDALMVKPFTSYNQAMLYAEKVESDSIFRRSISDSLNTLVISDANLDILMVAGYIDHFLEFDKSSYGTIKSEKVELDFDDGIDDSISDVKKQDYIHIDVDEPESESFVIDKVDLKKVEKREKQLSPEQKLLELERRQEQALSQSENILSEKDRRRILREREKERKEIIKQRQRELKLKEKQRNQELKQREKERKQKIKEQERIRKEKLKERAKILKKQKR